MNDVKLGITYASEFAYLADGENGLRVVQLTSPETPGNAGFSPRPTPRLIASFKLPLGARAGRFQGASTEIAPPTSQATRSESSAGSAHGR